MPDSVMLRLIRLYFGSQVVSCADAVQRTTGLPWHDCIQVYAAIQQFLTTQEGKPQ